MKLDFTPMRTAGVAALIALATACAPQANFPSLALRPAELDSSFEAPVRPAVDVASDAALLGQVAALESRARTGEQAFNQESAAASRAVQAAGAPQSESWTAAQVALSRLEASRAPTASALADLDALRLERAAAPTNVGDFARITSALAAVERLAAGQITRLRALQARLPGR